MVRGKTRAGRDLRGSNLGTPEVADCPREGAEHAEKAHEHN